LALADYIRRWFVLFSVLARSDIENNFVDVPDSIMAMLNHHHPV